MDLFYTPLDVAAILSTWDLDCRNELQVIDSIWNYESAFITPEYAIDRKKFLYAVRYWGHYFYDKPVLDREFPAIQRDMDALGCQLDADGLTSDFSDLDLFFKNMRLKILYGQGKSYIRIKLRTLLAEYGYKRRSPQLVAHLLNCISFYHLTATLKGGEEFDIGTVPLDKMITFRVEDHTVRN